MNQKILSIITICCFAATIASAITKETLADATKGKFLFGVAVNTEQVSGNLPKASAIITQEFNALVPENCMKPALIHPQEDVFNWIDADNLIKFGEKNHMTVTGHCLIWHSQIGKWFFIDNKGNDVSPEVLKERMRKHIHAVVGRYKGRIKGWDVVNEAIEDNGSYRKSKFYTILGKDFIKYAFQYAHEADPNAELYYNDYSVEKPEKCDAIIQLVKDLRAAGCRVDAVGSQSHMQMESPTIAATELSFQKLKAAGIKILITEWDISILPSPYTGADIATRFKYSKEKDPYRESVPDSIQQRWNKRVLDMFALFLKYSNDIDRVTLWGVTDKASWMNDFPIQGRKDYPLLFDRNNQPKSVVTEMIKMAKKNSDSK